MSKIALTPNASGTGTFTLASPNSSTSRTLTLPDTTGELLNDASSLASGKLTGALPAISGSSLTSLTSASLTGALPAIDGSALTGLSAGGLAFISSSDLVSVATADFTGFNSALYDSYVFTFANVIPATDNVHLGLRTSSNGGTSYDSGSTDYQYALFYQSTSTGAGGSNSGNGGNYQQLTVIRVGSNAGEDGVSGTVNILGPHLAKRTKMVINVTHTSTGEWETSTVGGGSRKSSADVDAVRFYFTAGNIESGTITMYGRVNS